MIRIMEAIESHEVAKNVCLIIKTFNATLIELEMLSIEEIERLADEIRRGMKS